MLKEIDFLGGVNPVLNFTVHTKEYGKIPLTLQVDNMFGGGRSARHKTHFKDHMDDLTKFGIPQDPYEMDAPVAFLTPPITATTSHKLLQYENATCGEVEPILLIDDQKNIYLTVGSEHLDRHMERGYKLKCKLFAQRVIAPDAWLYEDVKDHWDDLILRYYAYPDGGPGAYVYPTKAERVLGQEGECGQNYPPEPYLERLKRQTGVEDPRNSAIFLGTIPWLTKLRDGGKGPFLFAPAYEIEIEDPVLKRTIRHHYEVEVVWHRIPPNISKVKPPLI